MVISRENVDRVSFAGGIINTIAKTIKHTNIFDSRRGSDLVTDETLRKYRMAEELYRRGHEKKVSITFPDDTTEIHKEIFRRQTGFVRPEDLARMRQFERPEDHDEDDASDDNELDDYLPYTRQVSIQPPSVTSHHKGKTGFVRPDRKEKIKEEDEERDSSDPYAPTVDTSSIVPKTLFVGPEQRKARESPGGVAWKSGSDFRATRMSDFDDGKRVSDYADGKRRMSVLTRLIDDVTTTQDQGPTLKDYTPLSEQNQNKSLFLLTYSPTKHLNLTNKEDDPRELYLRRRTPQGNKSIDHILRLQHGKTVYRKISTDYVKTIDQIEKKEETSLSGLEYAKHRPSISVKEYRKQNQKYNESLARLEKLSKDDVKKSRKEITEKKS